VREYKKTVGKAGGGWWRLVEVEQKQRRIWKVRKE
jgi:hypothetical protein